MSPLEEIYCLLERKLKFSREDAIRAAEINCYLKKVIAPDVFKVIKVFESFGLKDDEIAEIAKRNPWMLTESFLRIKYLKDYYKMVDLTKYNELLKKQPTAMSVNPSEVKELIQSLKAQGKTNEEIQDILINDFDDYISL